MKRIRLHLNVHFIALVMLCCFVFTGCKNEGDMLQTLNDLKKDLAQTNDTLIGYSLKGDYALWIHEDEPVDEKDDEPNPGMQTLYKCTLSDGERTKLFTTNKDSIKVLIYGDKHVTIDRITDWKFTPDSLALIIEDGWNGRFYFTYMMHLNKDFKGVYDMGMDGIPEKINCDSIPVYVTKDLIDTKVNNEDVSWMYTREYIISSDGDKKIPNDSVTIYSAIATSGLDAAVKVKTSSHDTREDIKNKFFEEIAIKTSTLKELAKNQVKFERIFDGIRRTFDFNVKSLAYYDRYNGEKIYKLEVDDEWSSFTVETIDPNAAYLNIPARVIIQAYVKFHRNMFTDEFVFDFEDAKIIYSEPLKQEQ